MRFTINRNHFLDKIEALGAGLETARSALKNAQTANIKSAAAHIDAAQTGVDRAREALRLVHGLALNGHSPAVKAGLKKTSPQDR